MTCGGLKERKSFFVCGVGSAKFELAHTFMSETVWLGLLKRRVTPYRLVNIIVAITELEDFQRTILPCNAEFTTFVAGNAINVVGEGTRKAMLYN